MWSTVTAPDGTDSATIYVAANEKILVASCDPKSFNMTSTYTNGDETTGTFTGYTFSVDLDSGDRLNFQVHVKQVAVNAAPVYMRWTGSLAGRLNGRDIIQNGVALFEEFDLSS